MLFASTDLSAEEQFQQLLTQRSRQPENAAAIDAEMYRRFATTCAIAILDMSGFSRQTHQEGIIPTLQTIHTMREIAIPALAEQGGTVFKAEADNLYIVFTTADMALAGSQYLVTRLHAADIHASIGIGYGEVLVVGDRDVYGHEMNLASKLGEDVAARDEILLTAAAYQALTSSEQTFVMAEHYISGITVETYRLLEGNP